MTKIVMTIMMQMVAKMSRKTTMVFIIILCHDFLKESKVGKF